MDKKAYTKNQIGIGTFLGGPLAAVYMLKKNFDVMNDVDQSQKTTKWGLLMVFALVAIIPIMPQFIPSFAYAIGYTVAAQQLYVQKQISLKENPAISNWNVFGVAVASIAILIAVGLPLVFFYYEVGILKD